MEASYNWNNRLGLKHLIGLVLLFNLHFFGVVGLSVERFEPMMLKLVPLNLILTGAIVLLYYREWNLRFAVIALAGFWIEVLGVHSGVIFGSYTYGDVLGPQLFGVPLLIGLNWLILVYGTSGIASYMTRNLYLRSFIGAGLMVFLDYFIEPFAVKVGMWQWAEGVIPLQNYAAWFVIALVFHLYFNRELKEQSRNTAATWAVACQFGFFGYFWLF